MSRDCFALAATMAFPSLMAWIYFVALPPTEPQAGSHPIALVYTGAKVVQFAFPLLWTYWVDRRRLQLVRPNIRALALGTGTGLLMAGGAIAGYALLANRPGFFAGSEVRIRAKVVEFGLDSPARYVAFCLFLSVIHSFLEEYYWRWFVFGRLADRLRVSWAVLFSSAAFTAHHVLVLHGFFPEKFWRMVVPLSAGVAAGGILFAWLYRRTGSLYASWMCHVLIDAAILAVGYELAFVEQPS